MSENCKPLQIESLELMVKAREGDRIAITSFALATRTDESGKLLLDYLESLAPGSVLTLRFSSPNDPLYSALRSFTISLSGFLTYLIGLFTFSSTSNSAPKSSTDKSTTDR